MADERTYPHDPTPGPSLMPDSYGLVAWDASAPRDWSVVTAKLAVARNYWVTSASADGRPHAAPVWGLWFEGALCLSTGTESRKGRNLAARPDVIVHLESGDDVVLIDGVIEPMTDPTTLARFADAYHAKYAFRPDPAATGSVYLRVRPRAVLTWLESDFVDSAVRWAF